MTERFEVPLVGRRAELAKFDSLLRSVRNGRGRVCLVEGPEGIGKTRLLEEIARLARLRKVPVRWLGDSGTSSLATSPREDQPGSRRLQGAQGRTGQSRSRKILSWFAEPELQFSDDREKGREVDSSPPAPVLLLVDSIDRLGRPQQRELLRVVTAALRGPVLLVLSGRTDSGQESRRLRIRTIAGAATAVVRLPPLTRSESWTLAETIWSSTLGSRPNRAALEEAVEASSGNPLTLRSLISEIEPDAVATLPSRGEERASAARPRTPSLWRDRRYRRILAVFRSRLAHLPPRDRSLLSVAALFGMEFPATSVASVLGRDLAEIRGQLFRLVDQGWPLVLLDGRPPRYCFVNWYVWRSAREADTPGLGAPHRARLRSWLRAHRSAGLLVRGRILGFLGDDVRAYACARSEVLRLANLRSYSELVSLLSGPELGQLGLSSERELRLCLLAVGRLRAALQWREIAQILEGRTFETLSARERWTAEVSFVEGLVLTDFKGAEQRLRVLSEATREGWASGLPQTEGVLAYLTALQTLHSGEELARVHLEFERAIESLRPDTHPFERYRSLAFDCTVLTAMGEWRSAQSRVRQLERLVISPHFPAPEARDTLRLLRIQLAFAEGSIGRSLRLLRAELRLRQRVGPSIGVCRALYNLASFYVNLRNLDAAHAAIDQLEPLAQRLDAVGYLSAARTFRGWVSYLAGNLDEAATAFRSTEEIETGSDWGSARWASRIGLALIHAERGHPLEAYAQLPVPSAEAGRSANFLTEFFCARARIQELGGDFSGSHATLLLASERIRSPSASRLEVLHQLARWEQMHGTPEGAATWTRQVRGSPADLLRHVPRPWKGIWLNRGPPAAPRLALVPTLSRGATIPSEKVPLRHRVILCLRASERERGADSPQVRNGLTEREISHRLGLPREKFARALRRLVDAGLVDRLRSRADPGLRPAYRYRLTPSGSKIAVPA